MRNNILSQEEFDKIMKDHELWLDTHGVKGRRAELREYDLRSLNVQGVNFYKARLRAVIMSGLDLRGCILSNADFESSILENADLSGADLSGADLTMVNLCGADLSHAKLSNTTILTSALCICTNLTGVDLSDMDLRLVTVATPDKDYDCFNFKNTSLSYACLDRSNLEGCCLYKVNMSHSSLLHTNMNNTDLSYANLERVVRRSTPLYGVKLTGAIFDKRKFNVIRCRD